MEGARQSNKDWSHLGLASSNHSNKSLQLFGSCQFLWHVCVGILSYHLALVSSHKGRSERKFLFVRISTKGIQRVETSPLVCTISHITRLVTTIWDRDKCLWLWYWGNPYSIGASSGISQWDTFRHSPEVSHLWWRDVFNYASLPTMEALHFREGNGHPHRPPALVVHTNTRKVAEWSPWEVVTYLHQFHLNIKYKKGNTNNVVDFLSWPPIMALTTVLNSCGHESSNWPRLYKSDPYFGHTY